MFYTVADLEKKNREQMHEAFVKLVTKHEDRKTQHLKLLRTYEVSVGHVTSYEMGKKLCKILAAPAGTRIDVIRQFAKSGVKKSFCFRGRCALWQPNYISMSQALERLKAEIVKVG